MSEIIPIPRELYNNTRTPYNSPRDTYEILPPKINSESGIKDIRSHIYQSFHYRCHNYDNDDRDFHRHIYVDEEYDDRHNYDSD